MQRLIYEHTDGQHQIYCTEDCDCEIEDLECLDLDDQAVFDSWGPLYEGEKRSMYNHHDADCPARNDVRDQAYESVCDSHAAKRYEDYMYGPMYDD